MQELLNLLKKNIKEKNLGLHEPYFHKKDFLIFRKILSESFVGSSGKEIENFKKLLKKKFKFKNISLTNSGHASLFIILRAAGANNKDEILIPNLNYIASANAILLNQSSPHLIDISEKDLGVNVESLSKYLQKIAIKKGKFTMNKLTGKRIYACIALHPFGFSCNIFELKKLLDQYNILLIEDAAEALGSSYRGKFLGNIGYASALSFNANKIITCGGGGAIVSNDKKFIERCDHLVSVAKVKHKFKFYHDVPSFNFKMPNINAALGLKQLMYFDEIFYKKNKIHKNYLSHFIKKNNFLLMTDKKFENSNKWLNVLILRKNFYKKEQVIEEILKNKITVRPAWELMSSIPFLKKFPRMKLSKSKKIFKKIICLPSGINIL